MSRPIGYAGSALERFIDKCRFDARTGCVVWIGGKTQGRGHSVPYGSFWFEGRRWFAHRWSAKHIHGYEIDDFQVDHCCPHIKIPNTLCVDHVQPITPTLNRELQWIRVQVGLDPPWPAYEECPNTVPFFTPPQWYVEAGGR